MVSLRFHSRVATAIALAVSVGGLVACGDDTTGPDGPDLILGTWNVTAFATGTDDLIAEGMTLRITLDDDGTYTFVVTNDMAGICGGVDGENCTTSGSFAYGVSTVTIDDDVPADATTFTYGLGVDDDDVMSWTGTIGGTPVVISLARVP